MKVKFLPLDKELEIEVGQSVMDLAHKNGIRIHSVCNGMPSCAECRVRIVEGDWNVVPPSSKEMSLIGTGYFIDQRRLSCQVKCFGDITVDISEQLEKANEDPVSKKFLARAQKESAADSHALGGILIEQEQAILKEVGAEPLPQERPQQEALARRGPPQNQGQNQNRNPNQNQQNQRARQDSNQPRKEGEGDRPSGNRRGRGRRRRR